jgi:two-component system sensor histidine kinase/response regulator
MTSQQPLTPESLVPRIGDYLVERGFLKPEQLNLALETQKQYRASGRNVLLGDLLLELQYIDRNKLDQAITEQIIQLRNALQEANRTLEQRVILRTQELQAALNKLAELDKLKSNIIANISHELRTPLTHIKGYQELLLAGAMGALTPEQDSTLKTIRRSTERLERLIEDLINFSQMSKGDVDLKVSEIDVKRMVTNVIKHSIPKAEEKRIRLQKNVPDEVTKTNADEEKISWVIMQLLDNAIKFTPEEGQVTVGVQKQPNGLLFQVEDTGIGIPADKVEDIFQPFHQLDGSSTRRYGGTGLGLSLVRQIVEAHQAKITVSSEVGKYARFSFLLPYLNPD